MEAIIKTLLAIGGTAISFLFGEWHISLTILAIFMALDYITGIMKGVHQRKLSSSICYRGLIKKVGIIVAIIIANLLDMLIGNPVPVFRTMAVFFYVGNEGISIMENLGTLGVKVPKFIETKLDKMASGEDKPNVNQN